MRFAFSESGQILADGKAPTDPIIVSSASQLITALRAAQGGETILLAAGDYGDMTIAGVKPASTVTIASQNPFDTAVFEGITINNSRNLTFTNVAVTATPTAQTLSFSSAVLVTNSADIALTASEIRGGLAVNGVKPSATELDATGNVLGFPAGRAITILNSAGVTVAGNTIETFHKGIVVGDVDGLKIAGNEISDLRTSPITGGGVENVLIEGNYLHDSNPWNFGGEGDHGDFIHLWTSPDEQTGASANIVIRGNTLDQGDSTALLGIYLDDNNNGLGFKGVTIEQNVIINNSAQAIRLEKVAGVVSGNTLVQNFATDYHDYPGILALRGSDLKITNNIVSRIVDDADATVVESGNRATINGVLDAANPFLTPVDSSMRAIKPFGLDAAVKQSESDIAALFSAAKAASAGDHVDVFGTTGAESLTVARGDVQLDASFNRGGDTIRIAGEAADFTVVRSGSALVFDSTDLHLVIPVGITATTIEFAGGDRRALLYDQLVQAIVLGGHQVGFTPLGVTDFA
jgi:hypothetical protein